MSIEKVTLRVLNNSFLFEMQQTHFYLKEHVKNLFDEQRSFPDTNN